MSPTFVGAIIYRTEYATRSGSGGTTGFWQGQVIGLHLSTGLGAALFEQHRVPDLKLAAHADEGGLLIELRKRNQRRRQHNPPIAVRRQLRGIAENRRGEIILLSGEQSKSVEARAHLLHQIHAEPFEAF